MPQTINPTPEMENLAVIEDDEGAKARGTLVRSRRFAIVVGINNYEGTTSGNLNYCANDAEAFYDALRFYARYEVADIMLFSDGSHPDAKQPTYSDILSNIQSVAAQAGPNDTILIFFAGHGLRDSNDSYLLTRQYRQNILPDSSISLSKVDTYLRESKAQFTLRFFDACHSGRIGRRGADGEDELSGLDIEELLNPVAEGWATLAACKGDQYAHELSEIGHGIFSFFLVRGLQGEASTDNQRITLDNLKLYVMDKVIDLTRKRGITQTPVFSGEQAGQMVISVIKPLKTNVRGEEGGMEDFEDMPEGLKRIADFEIEKLIPETEDIDPLLAELNDTLQSRNPVTRYIAQNQEEKIEKINRLVKEIIEWLKERGEESNKKLKESDLFSVTVANIQEAPLNLQLAQSVDNTQFSKIIEFFIKTRKATRYKQERVKSNSNRIGAVALLALQGIEEPQYREVAFEVDEVASIEQNEPFLTTVVLQFSPKGHAVPKCAFVVTIIPSHVGSYAFGYFAASQLKKGMEEQWAPSSFSKRFFFANRMDIEPFTEVKPYLEEFFAQFISFIAECAKARQVQFKNMGISDE